MVDRPWWSHKNKERKLSTVWTHTKVETRFNLCFTPTPNLQATKGPDCGHPAHVYGLVQTLCTAHTQHTHSTQHAPLGANRQQSAVN